MNYWRLLYMFGALGLLMPLHLHAQEVTSKVEARKKIEELSQRLERAREREKGLALSLDKLRSDRVLLNKELIATGKDVHNSENRLLKIEGRIDELKAQENIIRGSLARRNESISKLLATMQRIGRQPPPVIVTERKDALKMVRSAMLLASIFPELRSQSEALVARLTDLQQVENKILRQRDALKIETANLKGRQKRVGQLLVTKREQLELDQLELSSIREKAKLYAKNIESMGELIARLQIETRVKTNLGGYERELVRKRQKEIQTGKKLEGKALEKEQELAFVNPGRIKPRLPFPQTKGLLSFPVAGVSLRNFGDKDEFGTTSKGIVIETRDTAQIRAPGDGWVIFAGEFRSYGKLLIIDAGGDYHIVLAGMKHIDVSTGQFVLAGEPVAKMGSVAEKRSASALKISPLLYIEFRKNGQPIDSKPWWENKSEKV